MQIPLPPPGPVRLIAAAGTLAILAFGAAAIVLAWRRRWPDAGWAVALLAVLAASFVAGAAGAHGWHVVLAACTLALGLRNAACFPRLPRALGVLGLVAWALAIVQAFAYRR